MIGQCIHFLHKIQAISRTFSLFILTASFIPIYVEWISIKRDEDWNMKTLTRDSPLTFKGIVFNEMKGVFVSIASQRKSFFHIYIRQIQAENLYEMELQCNLLPCHTYSHVSGGPPLDILKLTWEELKQFHSTHYHPSNSQSVYDTLSLIPLSQFLYIWRHVFTRPFEAYHQFCTQ